MSKKDAPKPFFQTRNAFMPSLENFVNKAMNLYQAADILTGDSMGATVDFPGRDQLRKRVEEFRAAALSDDEN